MDPLGHKTALLEPAHDAMQPTSTSPSKRQASLPPPKQRKPAYCAHAPEPYAAMASRGDWSTELWDIFAQPGGANMCCLSLWCPCIQYGLLLEQLPPGSVCFAGSAAGGCALFCLLWLLGDLLGAALLTKVLTLPCTALIHTQTRGYIRQKYGIQSHPIHDFFITWCCAPCALCQEARETVIRQAAEREEWSRPGSRSNTMRKHPDPGSSKHLPVGVTPDSSHHAPSVDAQACGSPTSAVVAVHGPGTAEPSPTGQAMGPAGYPTLPSPPPGLLVSEAMPVEAAGVPDVCRRETVRARSGSPDAAVALASPVAANISPPVDTAARDEFGVNRAVAVLGGGFQCQ